MTVEDVVKVGSEHHFFEPDKLLGHVERVAEVDIGLGVAGQRAVFTGGVVKILSAHVVCVPDGLQPPIVQVEETIENGRRRESEC